MAGLYLLLKEIHGASFDFLNTIIENPTVVFDVTSGSNGGFRAGPGRDETTGWGVPDGARMLAALGAPTPAPPAPTPTPTPVPTGDPLADFPTATVKAWLASKHDYNHAETQAATAITAWAAEHGISLSSK
jgi:kumamolisin